MPNYFRRVFRIRAQDSPNVRFAEAEIRGGRAPSGREIVPGVISYEEYLERRATWDPIRQTVGLDAFFYSGRELLLYPPDWLDLAEQRWLSLRGRKRQATAIGIDPAEGGDKTAMAAVDDLGLIELTSRKTPNTVDVVSEGLAFIRKHNVSPLQVALDRGGGGKQHADRMREMGFDVRTIAFGENLSLEPRRGLVSIEQKKEMREESYQYVNRRAQMAHELRLLLDPSHEVGFAIPPGSVDPIYAELRHQLAPVPLLYDPEGRIRMLPKQKRTEDSKEKTLVELVGHSPDEFDAVCLAVHARDHKVRRVVAGAL